MDLNSLFQPPILALMIPILVIAGGIVQMVAKHRERMAMIERGMNPDQVKLDREAAQAQLPPNDIRR